MSQLVNEAPKLRNRSKTQCLVRHGKPEIEDPKEVDAYQCVAFPGQHKGDAHLGAVCVANVRQSGREGLPCSIRERRHRRPQRR